MLPLRMEVAFQSSPNVRPTLRGLGRDSNGFRLAHGSKLQWAIQSVQKEKGPSRAGLEFFGYVKWVPMFCCSVRRGETK
jgi:hypothetical protein